MGYWSLHGSRLILGWLVDLRVSAAIVLGGVVGCRLRPLHGSRLVTRPHLWEGHRQCMGWGMCLPLEQNSALHFHIAESAPKYFPCIHPRPLI